VADQLVQQRVERIASQEHLLSVLEELGGRARRRLRERGSAEAGGNSFRAGLYGGYVQAIQLLLDTTYEQAKALVDEGWL
jgi:hypothetical protein